MALHLQELEDGRTLGASAFSNLLGEKTRQGLRRPVQDNANVGVACLPRVLEERTATLLKQRSELIAQPVEGLPERFAPSLVPLGVRAYVAATIGTPALDAVVAAPGGVLDDLHLARRRAEGQKLAVVGHLCLVATGNLPQHIRQRHLAEAVVMAVCLAVGGNLHQLRLGPVRHEAGEQALSKPLTVLQEPFEGHGPRGRSVVEEQRNLATAREVLLVRSARVDAAAAHLAPLSATERANSSRLMRRQDREADAVLGHDVEGLEIDSSLGEPHAFRVATEALLEIANAPAHLGDFVATARERHDQMIVNLRQRRAVSTEALARLTVSVENRGVGLGGLRLHPREQRRPKVEAHPGVVVDDVNDAACFIEDAGRCVGRVALSRHPLVPIMVRVGRFLLLEVLEPGVLPRRLVEMTVNAEIALRHVRTSDLRHSPGWRRKTAAKGGNTSRTENGRPW